MATPDHPVSSHGVQTYYSNYLQDFPTKVNSACYSKLNSLFFLQNLFLVLFVFSLFVEWPHHKVILVSFLLALHPPPTTPNQSQNPTCLFPNHLSEGSPPLRHSTPLFSTRTIARALQLVSPTPCQSVLHTVARVMSPWQHNHIKTLSSWVPPSAPWRSQDTD